MPYVPESWNSNASAKDKWQLSLSNYIFTAFLIFIDFIKATVAQTVNAPVQIRNLMQQLQTIRPNNTIKKYQQYFNAWRKWATDLNVSFLPGNPLYIGLYILHKIQAGHSLPTIDAIFFAIITSLYWTPIHANIAWLTICSRQQSYYQTIKPTKNKHCDQTNWSKYMTISQLINHPLKICDFWISSLSPSPLLWGPAKCHQ